MNRRAIVRRCSVACALIYGIGLHAGPLVNGSFESGLDGWSVQHTVDPVQLLPGRPNFQMSVAAAPSSSAFDGAHFLSVFDGHGSAVVVSQTFTMYAGQTLTGYASMAGFSNVGDPVPFGLSAQVSVLGPPGGSGLLWADSVRVENGQRVPYVWQQWSFPVSNTGDYTLRLSASNGGGFGANVGFDAIRVVPDVGEPLWLMSFALAAVVAYGRVSRGSGVHRQRRGPRRAGRALLSNPNLLIGSLFVGCFGVPRQVVAIPINGGFESGLAGWALTVIPNFGANPLSGGSASTPTSAWGYLPVEGSHFALLEATWAATVHLSQVIELSAGERLSGYAAAYAPALAISGTSFAAATVTTQRQGDADWVGIWAAQVSSTEFPQPGAPGFTEWQPWSFVAPSTGNYTVRLSVEAGRGGSFAVFDAVRVPDTTAMWLLWIISGGFIVACRMLRRF